MPLCGGILPRLPWPAAPASHRNTRKHLHHDDGKSDTASDYRPCCAGQDLQDDSADCGRGFWGGTILHRWILWILCFQESTFTIPTAKTTPSRWKVSTLTCAIISLRRHSDADAFPENRRISKRLLPFSCGLTFGLQKRRYRSRHPGTSVPFSFYDFF